MTFSFSGIVSGLAHLFTGAFTKAVPTLIDTAKTELTNIEASVSAFITTDLGKIAIDSVAYASSITSNDNAARDAAKAKFIADAKIAGHDLETVGLGIVDWMVQSAYTFTANVVAQLPTATPPAA